MATLESDLRLNLRALLEALETAEPIHDRAIEARLLYESGRLVGMLTNTHRYTIRFEGDKPIGISAEPIAR